METVFFSVPIAKLEPVVKKWFNEVLSDLVFNSTEPILTTQKAVLNINEVCILTGLSKSSIYKLTMNGKIPHYKQAKHLYFDRVEIENWLKSNRGFNVNEIKQQAATALNIKGGSK